MMSAVAVDTIDFIDVHGFAGGFTVGAVQAGMRLIGKHEDTTGFGVRQCEANRRVLGDAWEAEMMSPGNWTPQAAPVIISNPPCSAFSSMTYGTITDSVNHGINHCMWDCVRYAARVKPEVFVMESVQGAVVRGIPLMRQLRAYLESVTGRDYLLCHVLQNNAVLGGASNRRRYFLVLSSIPFGVETPPVMTTPTLRETIGDLDVLDYRTWTSQSYSATHSGWVAREVVSPSGQVDGHVTARWDTPGVGRLMDLLDGGPEVWPQNACLVTALRNYHARHGCLPESWHFQRRSGDWADEMLVKKNFEMGFTRPKRWVYDRPSHVVIGGAMYLVIHPTQDRLLTHRECARIMGFPDDWVVAPLCGLRGLEEGWGKGVSVQSGRWIAHWARQAVLGSPGSVTGAPVVTHPRLRHHGACERETVIDVSRVTTRADGPSAVRLGESDADQAIA